MKDEKKKEEKKLKTKIDLISVQKDSISEKDMELVFGGGDPSDRTCMCKAPTHMPTDDTTF